MKTTILVCGALLLLSVATGVFVRLEGRPLNHVVMAVHKLAAVGTLVMAIIAVRAAAGSLGVAAPVLGLVVFGGLLMVALFVSGALLSAESPPGAALLVIHMAAPALLAACALTAVWLVGAGGA